MIRTPDRTPMRASRRLAGYIGGKNRTKASISMAAPVTQEADGDCFRFTLSMPSKYTPESLPEPLDERVSLREWITAEKHSPPALRPWGCAATRCSCPGSCGATRSGSRRSSRRRAPRRFRTGDLH
jgi:hypothetical protein